MSAAEAGNELPYMPVTVAEELAIAEDLTNEQLGAYYRLKLKLWRANGYLPEAKMAAASRAGRRWGAIAAALRDHFAVIGGVFSNGGVLLALEAVRKRRGLRVERAHKAATARWEFERVHKSGKSFSELSAKLVSGVLLNADKSLKSLDPSMLEASDPACLAMPNQNQKNIDNSNTTGSAAAGGSAAGLSGAEPRRGVVLSSEQHTLIFAHGTALVTERLGQRRLSANSQMLRWLSRIGDADRLIMLLGMAEREDLHGTDFFEFVEEQVAEDEANRAGVPAPAVVESPAAPADAGVVPSAVDNAAAEEGGHPQAGGQLGAPPSDAAAAELWLASEGKRIVIERMDVPPTRAALLIGRWLRYVDGAHQELAAIIAAAAAPGLDGRLRTSVGFDVAVGKACERRRAEIDDGPRLAMGPAGASRGAQREPQAVDNATRDGESPPAAPLKQTG